MTWGPFLKRVQSTLKKVNSQFAPVARWTALFGIVSGFILHDYALAYGFLGLLLAPSVIGK